MARPLKNPRILGPVNQAVVELRTRLGNSQQSFAVTLGVALNTIARWEAGREPSGASLVQLHQLAAKTGHTDLAGIFWDAAAAELGQVGIQRVADIWSKATEALSVYSRREHLKPEDLPDFPKVLKEIRDICIEINPVLQYAEEMVKKQNQPSPRKK